MAGRCGVGGRVEGRRVRGRNSRTERSRERICADTSRRLVWGGPRGFGEGGSRGARAGRNLRAARYRPIACGRADRWSYLAGEVARDRGAVGPAGGAHDAARRERAAGGRLRSRRDGSRAGRALLRAQLRRGASAAAAKRVGRVAAASMRYPPAAAPAAAAAAAVDAAAVQRGAHRVPRHARAATACARL